MAYKKREMFKLVDDNGMKDELLKEMLETKKVTSRTAKETILFSKPRTLMRWFDILTLDQIEKYLVRVDEEARIDKEDVEDTEDFDEIDGI